MHLCLIKATTWFCEWPGAQKKQWPHSFRCMENGNVYCPFPFTQSLLGAGAVLDASEASFSSSLGVREVQRMGPILQVRKRALQRTWVVNTWSSSL